MFGPVFDKAEWLVGVMLAAVILAAVLG